MNPLIGWGLATAALVAGFLAYGWPGIALAVTSIVFWLLLQFNRSMRVMRDAGAAPIGHVDSAVMFHAKLKPGLQMLQVLTLTKSLGRRIDPRGDAYAWADGGGAEVVVSLNNGRVTHWELRRPEGSAE